MLQSWVPTLVARVDDTLRRSSGRFPMYADPISGEWTWSDDGGWFGGFWGGLLRLAALATGDTGYLRAAELVTARLRPRTTARTALRGFLFWYGAALASPLGQPSDAGASAAVEAARSLSEDVDPAVRLLPPGADDADLYGWPRPGACIDALPGVVPLLAFASRQGGDPALRDLALAHARGHARMCVRDDGSVAQSATFDSTGELTSQNSINGSSRESTWSRAQAWAMLGLAQAARLSDEFVEPATQVAEWYLDHVPEDLVCYWDFDDPAIPAAPKDTSATAIAASALAKLHILTGKGRYRISAENTVEALSDRLNHHGGLGDGCYQYRKGRAIRNELIWGDYFMLEASLAVAEKIDTSAL